MPSLRQHNVLFFFAPYRVFMLLSGLLFCNLQVLGISTSGLGVFFHLFSHYGVLCVVFPLKTLPSIVVRHVSWDENNYPSILLISGLDFMKWTQIQMLLLLYRQTRVGALAGILLVWQLVWVIYLYLLSKVQILDIYIFHASPTKDA